MHRHPLGEIFDARQRHVLELKGDHIRPGRQPVQKGPIVELAPQTLGHRAGAGVSGRIEKQHPNTQGMPGQGQHAGQLPAAEHADDHVDGVRGSGRPSTCSVWRT